MHQSKLVGLIEWIEAQTGVKPYVEVETNGTIKPQDRFLELVNQFNISPKLSNSGNDRDKRYKPDVLTQLLSSGKGYLKIVVASEDDMAEIDTDFVGLCQEPNQMHLMPAGDCQSELEQTRAMVLHQCIKRGYHYSDRLHIVAWNQKTGV